MDMIIIAYRFLIITLARTGNQFIKELPVVDEESSFVQ
jgi:hypothetical protein